MDLSDKIRELQSGIEQISAEERLISSRLKELKSLFEQKKKKEESLKLLKEEEMNLLKELGLL